MTVFTQAEIADLAINQLTGTELEEALVAFNGFSSIFGRPWIDEYFQGAKIPSFVRRVMDMWRDYSLIKGLPNADQITARWKGGINKQGVVAELRILAEIFRAGVELELFPSVSGRVPDARIRLSPNRPWTYVEASQRGISKVRSDSESAMQRIAAKALDVRPTLHSKVAISRLPTEPEMKRIIDWLNTFPESGSVFEDLVILWVEPYAADVGANDELCQHVSEPRLFMAQIVGGETPKKATVAMKIEDRGADRVMKEEAEQLPSSEPGIVIIDTSYIIGGTDTWERLIRRRLQPINTRIGAVILTHSLYGAKGRESEAVTVRNCHAAIPIDSALIERLKATFPAKSEHIR